MTPHRIANRPLLALHEDAHGLPRRIRLYSPVPSPQIIEYPGTHARARYARRIWEQAMNRACTGIPGQYGPAQHGRCLLVYLDGISLADWCAIRDELAALSTSAPMPAPAPQATQESML
jgi:hypothetical protein